MFALEIIVMIVIALAIYGGVAGFLYKRLLNALINACEYDTHIVERSRTNYRFLKEKVKVPCREYHEGGAWGSALFWPIATPFILAYTHEPRAERQKIKELATAEHNAKLAEINLRESKALDEQLRSK